MTRTWAASRRTATRWGWGWGWGWGEGWGCADATPSRAPDRERADRHLRLDPRPARRLPHPDRVVGRVQSVLPQDEGAPWGWGWVEVGEPPTITPTETTPTPAPPFLSGRLPPLPRRVQDRGRPQGRGGGHPARLQSGAGHRAGRPRADAPDPPRPRAQLLRLLLRNSQLARARVPPGQAGV